MPKIAMEELISSNYWINLEVIWNKKPIILPIPS